MELPKEFLSKMKDLLKDEFDDFLHSYEEPKIQSLRVNTLKLSIEEFLNINPFTLERIPWVNGGFFYQEEDRPGKHPYHEAGLYYIQEPSAMAVGEIVDPQPGEKVLDLCAAPGGKSTHMAAKMQQQGLLVSNELYPNRAKILSQNVERMGIKNAIVTNEVPAKLADRFPSFFDRIMVDAPCSGEGMFRKDPGAREEWSLENVAACAERQLDILRHAAVMLRPGGRLVYSTCTFSPEENEGVISQFLKQDTRFEIEDTPVYEGFDHGRNEWVSEAATHIEETIRIWPQQVRGEGHYIAVLRKKEVEELTKWKYPKSLKDQKQLKDFLEFAKETLTETPKGEFVIFGDQLYLMPEGMLSLEKLKIVRPGWHLGTIKKNRFEPSHALALSLKGTEVKNRWSLDKNSPEMMAYLKGESIKAEGPKGWYLVEVDGYSIGWGKLANGVLKNHFPKGLRWLGI